LSALRRAREAVPVTPVEFDVLLLQAVMSDWRIAACEHVPRVYNELTEACVLVQGASEQRVLYLCCESCHSAIAGRALN
jgi:hypothetical protein